jgi:hypothetical protein
MNFAFVARGIRIFLERLRPTPSFVPISPDQGIAFRPSITVPSRARLSLRGCVFFAVERSKFGGK